MSRTKYIRKENRPANLSQFPNFHKSGSIKQMKERFYGKEALLVQSGQYIYNVSSEPGIYFNVAH